MTDDKNLTEMSYGELKELAKARGLSSAGTKDELLTRLANTPDNQPSDESEEEEDEPKIEPPKPTSKPVVTEQTVAQSQKQDQNAMKKHLESQPKVSIMIPLDPGVPPAIAEKIPFVLNLNGYRMEVKRGVFVQVPEQVAMHIQERLESEGKIGSEYRLDRNADKQEALGS